MPRPSDRLPTNRTAPARSRPRSGLYFILLLCLAAWLGACLPPEELTEAPTAGASEESATGPSETPPAAATETPMPTRAVRVSIDSVAGEKVAFWHAWEGEMGEFIGDSVAAFNAQNPYGLIVEPQFQENMESSMRAALGAGTPPDLAVGYNHHAMAWDRGGTTLVDLNAYFVDPEFGAAGEQDDFYHAFLEADTWQGKQLDLPLYRTAEVLFYNRTWAVELGFSGPPETPGQLREQACAAAAAKGQDADPANDREGGLMLTYEPGALLSWVNVFGGSHMPGDDQGSYGLDKPEIVDAFRYTRGLLDEGCAWVPQDRFPNDAFALRRGLLLPATLAGMVFQQAAMEAAGSTDSWQVIAYPSLSGEPRALVTGPGLVIFSSTQERQLAAWLFARWLLAAERLAVWTETAGYFPSRMSVLQGPGPDAIPDETWRGAVEIVPVGQPLAPIASWSAVQWVLEDAARVLYAPLTAAEEIPAIVTEMDTLAEEVDGYFR